jgi:glutaredoxin
MGEHYTMWVKADCPFCISARDELYRQRVNHTINIMDDHPEKLDGLKELWSHSTVPIIIYRDEVVEALIGGYTDLKNWFDGREND